MGRARALVSGGRGLLGRGKAWWSSKTSPGSPLFDPKEVDTLIGGESRGWGKLSEVEVKEGDRAPGGRRAGEVEAVAATGSPPSESSEPAGSPSPAGPSHGEPDELGRCPAPSLPPIPLPPHWLDTRFPRARAWLDAKSQEAWIASVTVTRPRQYWQLIGRGKEIGEALERELARVLREREGESRGDPRAETHLRSAALAVATRSALLPWLRDEGSVAEIVAEHAGGRSAPVVRALLRLTRPFQGDGRVALARRLRALGVDYGPGFQPELFVRPGLGVSSELRLDLPLAGRGAAAQGEEGGMSLGSGGLDAPSPPAPPQDDLLASLTLHACPYHRLFADEGATSLLASSCCSQDRVWIESPPYPGIQGKLELSRAKGDSCCRFEVTIKAPEGGAARGGSTR